jgi:hypothetical protein
MGFKAWNIGDLAISLNGVPLDSGGYGEDEVMTVEWTEDWWTKYTGADGEVTRSLTNNFGATVTLNFAQSADANDRLDAILKADLLLPNGAGAGIFAARDLQGRLVLSSPRAWIIGPPALTFGKTVQVFPWRIDLADASGSVFGGR